MAITDWLFNGPETAGEAITGKPDEEVKPGATVENDDDKGRVELPVVGDVTDQIAGAVDVAMDRLEDRLDDYLPYILGAVALFAVWQVLK